MVKSGSEILNPRTGQRTIFLQTAADTGGKLLRMESFHPAQSPPEPEHVHPFQESHCQLVAGSLHFCIASKDQLVRTGETVVIPSNVPHYFWNDSDEEAHAVQEFRPALNIENFFDTYFALARAGKLNEKGLPNLLQMSVMLLEFDKVMRVTKPPRFAQLLLMCLSPLGRLLGYHGTYP